MASTIVHLAEDAWRNPRSTPGHLLNLASRVGVHDVLLVAIKRRLVLYAATHAKAALRYVQKADRGVAANAVSAAMAFANWEAEGTTVWDDVVVDAEHAAGEVAPLVVQLSNAGRTRAAWAMGAALQAAESVVTRHNLAASADHAQRAVEFADAVKRDLPGGHWTWLDWVVAEIVGIIKLVIPWPHPWDVGDVVAHGDGWVLYHTMIDHEDTDPPLFSAQVTPRGKFDGWLPGESLYNAVDFIGHMGADAMRDAMRQLKQTRQLEIV